MQLTSEVAVVHLVRAGNGNTSTAQFIDSYIKHPAGYTHNLVFLLKGFAGELPNDLAGILGRVPHTRIVCPEGGYDIGSYYHASERISEPVVLFLNSFSIIQSEQWLLKLVRAYREPGVGLVGATGSWESLVSTLLTTSNAVATSYVGRWFARLRSLLIGPLLWVLFPAFPNPHVRSNAFLLAREDFLAMKPLQVRFKLQTWLFESGRTSMTRRILGRGLRVVVIGRDGIAYGIPDWPNSRIFWQHKQENLLIHDNRTVAYSRASETIQAQMRRSAWNCRRDLS